MHRRLRLVTALCLLLWFAPTAAPQGQPAPTDRYGDPLPAGAIARLGTERLRPGWNTFALAFSADGKLLASAHENGRIELWDGATGKYHGRLTAPDGADLHSLAYSPDGKHLAVGSEGHRIWLWSLNTGKPPRSLLGHVSTPCALTFSPNGKTLASAANHDGGAADNAIRLWNVATGLPLRELVGNNHRPTGVAFLKDNKRLVSVGGPDGTLRIWDLATGGELGRHALQGGAAVALQALPDGKTVATLTASKHPTQLEYWDVDAGKLIRADPIDTGGGRGLAAAPAGGRLALTAADGLHLLDAATGKTLHRFQPAAFRFWVAAFSPDGKRLAAATPGRIYLWDAATTKELTPPDAHDGYPLFVRFLPGDQTILTAGRDQMVRLWDAATGKPLRHFAVHKQTISWSDRFDLSPNGSTLAVPVGTDGLVTLWDPSTGKQTATLKKGSLFHTNLAVFSPDGKVLAVASHGQSLDHRTFPPYAVCLLEVGTGKLLHQLNLSQGRVESLLFSPDGKLLLVSGHALQVYEVATGKPIPGFPKSGRPLFFLPDGHTLALATGDMLWESGVAFWDLKAGKLTPRLPQGASTAFLGVTPGCDAVVVGPIRYADEAPRLRDLMTGKLLARPVGHRGNVAAVAFSADGKRLATAGFDNTVLVWDVAVLRRQQSKRRTKLTAAELERLWTDLGTEQTGKYLETIDRLVEAPDTVVAFLHKQLTPVSDAGLAGYLVDLDAGSFARREKAMKVLRRMELAAAVGLRKVLEGQTPLELRRRTEALLKELQEPVASEHLRTWRAVTVLEQANTPAARQLLEALAGGVAEARLTRDAQAAVERLTAATK